MVHQELRRHCIDIEDELLPEEKMVEDLLLALGYGCDDKSG